MPPPTEEELAEQHRRDTETKHYKWTDKRGVEHERDFTLRDALDRQREMERNMRDTRRQAATKNAGGLTDEYIALKARYTAQRKAYEHFSSAMDIPPQWERVYMDGLGRI